MEQPVSRTRILRITLTLAVLVLGATGAGVYLYHAATTGDSQAAPADQAQADDGENRDDGGSGGETGDTDDEDGDTPIPVSVAEITVGDVSTYITATANLVPEDEVKVLAEADGRVAGLLVEEGDHVRKGQVLAELLKDEAEILVLKAQLTTDNARMAYERALRMHEEQLIALEDFDKATMDHRIAQQELAEARWRLERTQIRSPFDGRVTLRNCTLGQNVRMGDELFTVTDFDPLIARIYLPEKEVLALDEGRPVRLTLKADGDVTFRGRIRQISPVVDTATGTVKVTVEALEPPAGVRPGGFVAVDITRETRADSMLLPKQAVIRELAEAHVFVVIDNVAEKREVTLGLEEGEQIEITGGISREERIIVAGQGGLDDGDKIKVLSEETEARAAIVTRDTARPARG